MRHRSTHGRRTVQRVVWLVHALAARAPPSLHVARMIRQSRSNSGASRRSISAPALEMTALWCRASSPGSMQTGPLALLAGGLIRSHSASIAVNSTLSGARGRRWDSCASQSAHQRWCWQRLSLGVQRDAEVPPPQSEDVVEPALEISLLF